MCIRGAFCGDFNLTVLANVSLIGKLKSLSMQILANPLSDSIHVCQNIVSSKLPNLMFVK